MNFRETIIELLEAEASRKQMDYVLKLVDADAKAVAILVDLAMFGSYPHANRAGWVLDILDRKHPEWINPHLTTLLNNLVNIQSDSVKRPVLSILSKRKLPKEYQGFLIDFCFEILQNAKEKVAAKVFAMEILANIADDEPDLIGEFLAVIDFQGKIVSSGVRARARNIRKRLSHFTHSLN